MELWIRSQDREKLIKIEKLFIDSTCPEMESTGKYCIGTEDWYGNNKYYKLGMYKTKERALEVFDEIYEILQGAKIIEVLNDNNGNMDNLFPILTYEMPKE